MALQTIIAGEAELNIEIAKLPVFSRETSKIEQFITACRLYLRIRIREATVEKQIQYILSYMQKELANVWKENFLEDLELEEVEFGSVGKFC